MRKKLCGMLLGLSLTALAAGTAFGADGRWIPSDNGWQYERADGSMAKSCWEDIGGEWYFFGSDGFMETGWHKIDNIRYHFEESGALSEGWQCYSEDGGEKWYYYNKEGNAETRWFSDNGKWYWFNPNGILSKETAKTIDGKRYYFHEDGSLKANEYTGIRYINADGQLDEAYDVRGEKRDGKKLTIDEDAREEIEEQLNALPSGWLKKFVDDGWTFIYCPEREYYSSAKYGDGGEKYYIRYKLSSSKKTLRFTRPEAVRMGFGEYIYQASSALIKEYQFRKEADFYEEAILELTELPEYFHKDYETMFAALFDAYLEEGDREEMEADMDEISWILGAVIGSRGADGKPVSSR